MLAAVEAGHELGVAYPDSPLVGGPGRGRARRAARRARPRRRPAGPRDGSPTSLRELLRDPGPQLWLCAGAGRPDEALALAERFGPADRGVRLFVIADRPPAGRPGVELIADPALRAHGRLGAVADAAFVVRPDGYLGFRCEPPDEARLAAHLALVGLRA